MFKIGWNSGSSRVARAVQGGNYNFGNLKHGIVCQWQKKNNNFSK